MSSIYTPGFTDTTQPGGKRSQRIPISTTTDAAPSPTPTTPVGFRLIGTNYTRRPDGGRDYVLDYEEIVQTSSTDISVNGQAAEQPIETHPSFNGASGFGTVSESDLLLIRGALGSGTTPTFTGTGLNLTAAEDLLSVMNKGITNYYTPSGISYSETVDQTSKPSIAELCTVQDPPSDAPTLAANQNWLFNSLNAQKVLDPLDSTSYFWRVTRQWIASGPRGWNADFNIYTEI